MDRPPRESIYVILRTCFRKYLLSVKLYVCVTKFGLVFPSCSTSSGKDVKLVAKDGQDLGAVLMLLELTKRSSFQNLWYFSAGLVFSKTSRIAFYDQKSWLNASFKMLEMSVQKERIHVE